MKLLLYWILFKIQNCNDYWQLSLLLCLLLFINFKSSELTLNFIEAKQTVINKHNTFFCCCSDFDVHSSLCFDKPHLIRKLKVNQNKQTAKKKRVYLQFGPKRHTFITHLSLCYHIHMLIEPDKHIFYQQLNC